MNACVLNTLESLTPQWFELLFPTFSTRLAEKFRENFEWTIEVLLEVTSDILLQCRVSLDALDEMKGTLAAIHDIVSRERIVAMNERDTLRTAFWTQLGGNRSRLRLLADHLSRLRSVAKYRMAALKHVLKTSEGVAQLQTNVLGIRKDASMANCPPARLTSLYMKAQLTSVNYAMRDLKNSVADVQKKSLGIGKDVAEEVAGEVAERAIRDATPAALNIDR